LKLKWVAIFNEVEKKQGDKAALVAANSWLKKQIGSAKKKEPVKRTLQPLKFIVDHSGEFIKRSEDNELYVSAVLQDVHGDRDGVMWSPEVLQKWADDINKGTYFGDVDHQTYDQLLQSSLSDEELKERLKDKKGIVKTVKALYEKGNLWVRLLIDKRYKKQLEKAQGLSLEAFVEKDGSNKVVDGDFLGFSVVVDDPIANPRATFAE
jgi:hypothetical protein